MSTSSSSGKRWPRSHFKMRLEAFAAALAQGQGFCCVFHQPTGPRPWLSPVYPFSWRSFQTVRSFTAASFYLAAFFNCLFSALVSCRFLCGTANRKSNHGCRGRLALGCVSQRNPYTFRMDMESSLSALLAISLLWSTFRLTDDPRRRNFICTACSGASALLVNPALGASSLSASLDLFSGRFLETASELPTLPGLSLSDSCLPALDHPQRRSFHRFIPIRSDFPFDCGMGNNPIYDEHSRQMNRITRYERRIGIPQLGEAAFRRKKAELRREFHSTHPATDFALAGQRAVAIWMGDSGHGRIFCEPISNLVRFVSCGMP